MISNCCVSENVWSFLSLCNSIISPKHLYSSQPMPKLFLKTWQFWAVGNFSSIVKQYLISHKCSQMAHRSCRSTFSRDISWKNHCQSKWVLIPMLHVLSNRCCFTVLYYCIVSELEVSWIKSQNYRSFSNRKTLNAGRENGLWPHSSPLIFGGGLCLCDRNRWRA